MRETLPTLGGLSVALDVYRASLMVRGDQRGFLGLLQVWHSRLRDDAISKQVVSDPHSPRHGQANGAVRKIDAW